MLSVDAGFRQENISSLQWMAYKVCDTVISNAKESSAFSGHLAVAVLFDSENFPGYFRDVPPEALRKVVSSYSMLSNARLLTEPWIQDMQQHKSIVSFF